MRKLALLFAVTVPLLATPLWDREAPPQAPAQATRPLKLALFGQSIIRYDLRRESPESAEQMTKLINGYDVAFTDFEAVLDKSDLVDGTARPASRGLIHRATSGAMESLKAMGVNMVSLANNHSFDLGEEGVFSTITGARRAGFAHSGTGANIAQAAAPGYLQTAAGLVALVSFTSPIRAGGEATDDRPGAFHLRFDERTQKINEEDRQRALASVREAAQRAPYVMVYHHCHHNEPQRWQVGAWRRQFAHDLLDAGASLYLAHGTPVNRPIEIYKGKPILYGLSNWIFQVRRPIYYAPDPEAWRSVLASVTLEENRVSSFTLTPLVLHEQAGEGGVFYPHGAPRLATGAQAKEILQLFADQSRGFGTEIQITGETARVNLPR